MINIRMMMPVFFLSGFLIALPSYAAPAASSQTAVGRVVWVKGNFNAIAPDNASRELKKLSVIYLKDTLITDNKSQAQIVFTDNSLMTFKPATKFSIDEYQYNPQSKKRSVGKYIMSLIEGGFRTITGLVAKNNPSNYQVNTPVATIGVRGTDYAVYLDNQGELFIGSYSGTPCVDNKKGNLCLDEKTRYASVKSSQIAPVPLSQQPTGFTEKLEITPAKIAYTAPGGEPGGGIGASFCIIQ